MGLWTRRTIESTSSIRSDASRLFSDFTPGATPARRAPCDRIATTVSAGGCVGEDITYIEAVC